MAYCSDYSSNHSSDCSDYSGFLSNLGLDFDSDSGTCSNTYYLHTVPVVVDSVDSHAKPAILSSTPSDNPYTVLSTTRFANFPWIILNSITVPYCFCSCLVNCATWFTRLLRTSVSAPAKDFLGVDLSRGH